MHDYDAITRRAVFRNVDTRPRTTHGNSYATSMNPSPNDSTTIGEKGNSKVVQKASSVSIDFEATAAPFHLIQLSGR